MRIIRRITPDNLHLLQHITDDVLIGEETLLRITRTGFTVDYLPLPRAEWRSFPPVPSSDPLKLITAPDGAVFAAFEGEHFIGQAVVRIHQDTRWCELLDIRVDAAYRRTGAGCMLLDACDRYALQKGAQGLRLTVSEDHPAMCQFCAHNGFTLGGLDRMVLMGTDKERVKPLARRSCALFYYRFSAKD